MNFLKNNPLLRGLLSQGDQLHTINGGVAPLQYRKENTPEGIQIHIKVPSVAPEAYQAVVHGPRLVVQVHMAKDVNARPGFLKVPMHNRIEEIPVGVDLSRIEAVVDAEGLHVMLPYTEGFSDDVHPIPIRRAL